MPAEMKTSEFNNTVFYHESSSKNTLYAFKQAPLDYKACVLLIHGLNEHCERYRELATFFNENNYAFYSYDQIGHGRSSGLRNHSNIKDNLTDITNMLERIKQENPELPVYLIGHSFGGLLVLFHALNTDNPVYEKVLASAPAVQPYSRPNILVETFGKIFYKPLNSLCVPSPFNTDDVSRDKEMVKRYISDPYIINSVSNGLGMDILRSGDWLLKNTDKAFPVPAIIMQGTEDRITSFPASEKFCAQNPNIEFKQWQGAYHEIFNEINRKEIMQFALQWLES